MAGRTCTSTEEIRVHAQVQIKKSVAVVIGHRDGRENALQWSLEAKCVGHWREPPVPVIGEKERPRACREHQILIAVVVHVCEE